MCLRMRDLDLFLATATRVACGVTSSLKADVVVDAHIRFFAAVVILFFTNGFVSSDFPLRYIP